MDENIEDHAATIAELRSKGQVALGPDPGRTLNESAFLRDGPVVVAHGLARAWRVSFGRRTGQ